MSDTGATFLSTELPTTAELPPGIGYEKEAVDGAFAVFRQHLLRLSARLRVEAASRVPGQLETAHPLRMDALALVRAAAEIADGVERDALEAACHVIERARGEVVVARREAKDALKDTLKDELVGVEAQAQKLLDAARDEAERLVAAARSEVVDELESAQAQGRLIVDRAEQAALKLLAVSGLEPELARTAVDDILSHVNK